MSSGSGRRVAESGPAGAAGSGRRVGVDTGGTFTDVVAEDGTIVKVPSTPDDPSQAVSTGIEQAVSAAAGMATVGNPAPALLAHGTTVATNALLERRGATVALLATEGFADVIEIARQRRPSLYDQWADRPEPLVSRDLRFGVRERLGPDGAVVQPLDLKSLPAMPERVDAVAVSLLHADLDPEHEQAVAEQLRAAGHDVTCSHEVSPEFREYERTVTTVVNAYLRPVCRRYLQRLEPLAERVVVMTSAGGLMPLDEAAERPAALLLSGPAGGVLAGAAAAAAGGFPDAVTFDMGGTSTDVCLVRGGSPEPAAQRTVAGFAIRMPSLDVHTIGAGGGSMARIDAGGALVVGPRSAGAVPGPACYGRGGTEPTVTDADLVLGRIPADAAFPGLGRLDVAAARAALDRARVDAAGVVDVVDAAMVGAVRAVSVERGVDPRGLALVAFGGAGPLHACAMAEALGMPAVVVPPRAGVLSAVGILGAPRAETLVRSWPTPKETAGLDAALAALAEEARRMVTGGRGGSAGDVEAAVEVVAVAVEVAVDCRYAGQSHELTVSDVDAFAEEHRRRNGYARHDAPVEVVALRATARVMTELSLPPVSSSARAPARGPAVLTEPDCTVWVPPGWQADVHPSGAWVITR